jgi:pimeloyl-ACP methyl ester carboxylesterase
MILMGGCGYMRMVGDEFRRSVAAVDFRNGSDSPAHLKKADSVLMGRVNGTAAHGNPVAVTAFSMPDGSNSAIRPTHLVDYNLLPGPGPYALFVPEGAYTIATFIDTNRNYILEEKEFAGYYGSPDTIAIKGQAVAKDLDITLKATDGQRFKFPISLQKLPYCKMVENSIEMGGTVDLDNDAFARKYGSMGLWQPRDFIDRIGIHVYALEPFDPSRVPVLFIHGISGSPRDWRYLAQQIDRRYFQCWFFYYPTGTHLNTTAELLHEKIEYLYDTYRFDHLCIVAHSMGGLVARAFIGRQVRDNDAAYIPLFISISTPWGGDKSARFGVETAPLAVDSWRDIAAGSRFLKNLHRPVLPDHLQYHLFYSYGGNNRLHRETNDGTVTLASQLQPSAKAEADQAHGFYENHMGILYSAETATELNRILLTATDRNSVRTLATSPAPLQDGAAPPPPVNRSEPTERQTDNSGADPATPYIRMLKSIDSVKKREAARHILRKQLMDPDIFETAEAELIRGYRINLNDNRHVDAMAWMCNLLGASGTARYRSTLEKVAQECPNRKIQRYAHRNLRKLL